MPGTATEPCSLYTLPANATQYDLEVGYSTRGSQIVECNGRRELAVNTHKAEHELEARLAAERAEAAKPWWHFWPARVARPANK